MKNSSMFFGVFIAITVSLSALNAQIFVEDVRLSKSLDVTHLRIEYHTSNNALENDALTYSLWKGNTATFVVFLK